MLAASFGFYHFSMGDARRKLLVQTKSPIPGMPDEINKLISDGQEIPEDVLAQFRPVPVILKYHNCRVKGVSTWSVAPDMMEQTFTEVRAEGKHKAIIVDGFPLVTGNANGVIVRHFIEQFSGLTIVLESPLDVAKKRYLERERLITDTAERFEARAERTDRALPQFLELMAGLGSIVVLTNDGTMTIDETYNALVAKLRDSPIFLTLTEDDRNST
jgi:hypothetical protein